MGVVCVQTSDSGISTVKMSAFLENFCIRMNQISWPPNIDSHPSILLFSNKQKRRYKLIKSVTNENKWTSFMRPLINDSEMHYAVSS